MKTLLVSFLLCFTSLANAVSLRDNPLDVRELSIELGIPCHADLVAETQKQWLRKEGHDRWEVEEISEEKKQIVLRWAEAQGMFLAWKPIQQHYDKAVILGTSTTRMKTRLCYLKELWEQGVRFKEIVWLTGDRPLDARIDDEAKRCDTEPEAAHIVWQECNMPKEMRALPVLFVTTPMKCTNGLCQRPNTQDTLYTYLQIHPRPCTLLFVSDQPFCGYQLAVIEGTMPASFSYDLVGPGKENPAAHPQGAAILLDNIARWLYQQEKNRLSRS